MNEIWRQLKDPRVEVRACEFGLGVFALTDFDKNEVVTYIAGPYVEEKSLTDEMCKYAIENGNGIINPLVNGNETRGHFVNSPYALDPRKRKRSNAKFTSTHTSIVKVRALKRIKKGTEILVNYGRGRTLALRKEIKQNLT